MSLRQQMIDPEKIPTIFKASLQPELLEPIIDILLSQSFQSDSELVVKWFVGLSQVPRFDMLAMFLDDKFKQGMCYAKTTTTATTTTTKNKKTTIILQVLSED
jgi:hypothetical protein